MSVRPTEIPAPGPWTRDAACRGVVDPDAFFPVRGGVPGAARAICNVCPVIMPCRAYALTYPGLQGIWGGTSGKDRRILRRTQQLREAS